MMRKPFEPGWEIGVIQSEGAEMELRTVIRITLGGVIVLDDDSEWANTGLAAGSHDEYPHLAPITKAWRQARRTQAAARLIKTLVWSFLDDSTILSVYDMLEKDGVFEPWQLDEAIEEMNAEVAERER